MDSLLSRARSPPQFSKDLVHTAVTEYKILLEQIASKTNAIDKLQHKTPKSIQHKIHLKLSQLLRDMRPNQANELQNRFNAAIQAAQATMRDVILETTKIELELLLKARQDFRVTYGSKFQEYFKKVFIQVRQLVCTDATIEFAPDLPDKAPALLHLTIDDLKHSVAILNESLDRIDYEDTLSTILRAQRQAERQAQRDSVTVVVKNWGGCK